MIYFVSGFCQYKPKHFYIMKYMVNTYDEPDLFIRSSMSPITCFPVYYNVMGIFRYLRYIRLLTRQCKKTEMNFKVQTFNFKYFNQ